MLSRIKTVDMKRKKSFVILTILFLILSACGGSDNTSNETVETTEETTTTTAADVETSSGEVYNEANLVVPPILLKPLIGATGILTSTSEDWEIVTEIVPLDMGVKIRTADNGTAQMTFEDGSALLMGGNSVINIRSFDYDEEEKARVLTVDVVSGSIAYDIRSEGLSASLAKIVTPTAELSVHGTEGVFEYDVTSLSAKSTVLEGGEESDDAVFSELLPNEEGVPVLVAVSQTAGTELGSATTGGSGWADEDSSTVALIVDEFVSNMQGECSYTCKAETQEGLAEGSEQLTADVAVNAVFTESDNQRMDLAQTLLVAAGAPEEMTDSVEVLAEVVQEVAVPNEVVEEFITANWQEAPEDGPAQELPPISEFFGTFEDAVTVHENDKFQDLGFDHNENGSFRAQHGMMQFISADTNAVNELANSGNVASAMALAAANMFVNAGQDNFVEGTYCADNPNDPECAAGAPPPEFLAQAFAGNHFVEDMVQGMGFEYSFTENDIKPGYCDEQTWLPECSDGPQFVGDAFETGGAYCDANPENCEEGGLSPGSAFFGNKPVENSFCDDNPDDPECIGGNTQAVYTFFHVYDDDVLGDDWEPVNCEEYPDDPMCAGEGDFFHEFVGTAAGLALDRNDMFDIYGGPALVTGPPGEFCNENPESYECSEDFKAADIYSDGVYVAPTYCDETPDAPECSDEFGNNVGFSGLLTAGMLAQYAAPDPNAFAGEKPSFCTADPNHPECFRDYYDDATFDKGEFLGNMFSDESYVDLTQQGVFYNAIEGADELASKRYGSHDDYRISEVIDCTDPSNLILPQCSNPELYENSAPNFFAGGEEGLEEFQAFNPEDLGGLCEENPQDPLCYSQPLENGIVPSDIFGPPEDGALPPGTPPTNVGFWDNEENAQEFQNQSETFTDFAGNYCEENQDDPTCSQVTLPPPQDGIIQDQECDDNPYAPGCPQSGGQEGQGPPPEGEGIDCGDPSNSALPQCTSPGLYDDPGPGEEYAPPAGGEQNQEDCADNPYAPGCQPPTDGEEYAPPAGGETPPGYDPTPPVEETPPAPPVEETPPAPPVEETPPAPPVEETPPAGPASEPPPAPPAP